MAVPVRYVCLSDLHLGSDRSLLTGVDADGRPGASDVLRALVECCRSVTAANFGVKPVLVLNGDIFELALASDEVSATVFQRFMELVMVPGDEVFEAVWYVPGNHDHHLWETARETQFADFLARHDPALEIPHPWYTTRMMRENELHPVPSPLLTTLLRRARATTGGPGDTVPGTGQMVSASYPNLGLVRGDRAVVFHHGHYIEAAYKLLTNLNTSLFNAPPPADVSQLEEGNFAWIDFFWSALGRAGEPGESVQYVYDHLRSPAARADLVDRLSHNLARVVRNRTSWNLLEDEAQAHLIGFVLGQLNSWADTFGRRAYYGGTTAVKAHDRGLEEYVGQYVREQLERESAGRTPTEVTFVFGHTHHPLVRRGQTVKGFGEPLAVYNTGGWVHETAELEPQCGASMVLVDDELNTVAIELYREVRGLSTRYVRLEEATTPGQHSPLFEHLQAVLADGPSPWRSLVSAIEDRLSEPVRY
ncbi:MAG TPA: metallophosphoesterase [Coriobacteriia bacterium]|nr:metallophosphoesterase [Coriobacteriia bacterium]